MRPSPRVREPERAAARSGVRPWPTALLLASASFLVLFDSLAIATALPSIGADLDLRPAVLQWVVSLYSLSIGAVLVLAGRICVLWGRRRVLVAALALCAMGSLLAALAPGLLPLLAGRVLQGVAAGFAIPAAMATAATLFEAEPWKSRVFSVLAFAAWSAGLAGAMLGGLITVHLGWRWVFGIAAPFSAVAAALTLGVIPPDASRRGTGGRLDVAGALLASTGLVALILGFQRLGGGGPAAEAIPLACAGLVLLAGLVAVERRAAQPLVPPGLVRSRRMTGSGLAFGLYCAGYEAIIVVGSLYLQEVHRLSAAAAGLALSPVLVGAMVSSSFAPRLLRRYGTRAVVAAAIAACAVLLAVIAFASRGSVPALLPWLALWGVGSGPVYVGLSRECVADVAEDDRGTASALFESTSQVGGAISVAAYLTLIGGGFGYRSTELVGVALLAVGALFALLILPRDSGRAGQGPAS